VTVVICVVSRGRSRGKTSLIEALTEQCSREGVRVATVKHIHGSFDTVNKDTWRHLDAGAAITVASTPTEVVTIRRSKTLRLEEALEAIYVESDLILVEGYKESSYPKILCVNSASDARAAINDISNILLVSGSIASKAEERAAFQAEFPEMRVCDIPELLSALKEMLAKDILQSLPGLNCGHCGYDMCIGLAKAILKGEATRKQCEVLSTNLATLRIDGRVIPLGRFPQEVLRGVTVGVLTTLKGIGKSSKNIEVTIKTE
jgi:molybdopterin-guanine dinucleotide biosynthesis protein B